MKVEDQVGQYENEEENMSSWREDVIQALKNLGGKARLVEIYPEVANLRPKPIIPSYEATVRRTLQENSSDTASYKGKYDIFTNVGSGIWALRNYPNELELPSRVTIEVPKPNDQLIKFSVQTFVQALADTNLQFDRLFIIRFIASLMAKKFAILTGLSGSGKTKLATTFANWISERPEQVCLVPVGADWTNREALLGFSNALVKGSYVKPDTGVIDLLIRAEKDPTRPYFLILDEMNLSHVERYFADFLSAMESEERILLHPDDHKDWNGCDVPATISLPNNLFIIGTVNVDETTYMFSPKVLDRAFVHEFRVSSKDMHDFLTNPLKADISKINSGGKAMAKDFLDKAKASYGDFEKSDDLKNKITLFFDELKSLGSEFGYRTASEIFRYGAILSTFDNDGSMDINKIIDAAVVAKLLPKIHGSRRKLEQTLIAIFKLCLLNTEGEDINDYVSRKKDVVGNENIVLPVSLEKIVRMYRQVIQDGFTSFSEA